MNEPPVNSWSYIEELQQKRWDALMRWDKLRYETAIAKDEFKCLDKELNDISEPTP